MGMNLQGEAGTEEKCAFACAHATDVYVGRGVFVCERGVHIPAPCPCVWIWSGCSLPAVFPHFFFLLTAELVYLGERGWENLWGRTWWSRRETQPTNCLQLTGVSWCRGVTQNTIGSIFALAWFPCFGKIWTVGMGCDSFNLQKQLLREHILGWNFTFPAKACMRCTK